MNTNLYIKSVNTNNKIGKAVQDYADYHFRTGFYYGTIFGIFVSTITIVIFNKKLI